MHSRHSLNKTISTDVRILLDALNLCLLSSPKSICEPGDWFPPPSSPLPPFPPNPSSDPDSDFGGMLSR